MNPVARSSQYASSLVVIAAGWCTWAIAAPGPPTEDGSNGTLIVRVSEAESGKPVPIANVLVIGKHTGALVDTAKAAMLVSLSPGRWILRTQVIRRDPEIDTVSVAAGETTAVSTVVRPLTARESDCVLEVRPIRRLDWAPATVRSCDWQVTSARPATPRDVPFDEGAP